MDESRTQFLNILRAAVHGERCPLPDEAEAVYALARLHKVLPLVYGAAPYPPERNCAVGQMLEQYARTAEFLELYRHLTAAGITPLVVKGLVCRSLYPEPDLRPSADEDLFLPPEQFDACHRALLDFGMTADDTSSFEVTYRKAGTGLHIELHKQLFAPDSDAYGDWNRHFEGCFSRSTVLDIDGTPVHTLGAADHLFYLLCHALKHFLHSGFGIRQVCDIVLFAQRRCADIDWNEFAARCEEVHATLFADAIFRIGENRLGLPCPPAFAAEVDETPLLEDILSGGIYGGATESRQHSSNITLQAASGKTGGLLRSLFPPRSALQSRYPYLKDRPWLLPAAWCTRLLRYRGTPRESAAIGAQRVALLKQYGIISRP